MSVRITDGEHVALYDSVTGEAFGPVMDSEEHAERFLEHLRDTQPGASDPRKLPPDVLQRCYARWAARQ
jgi:hypothetical protein